MKSLKQNNNLKGQKVLLRLDLNVPLEEGKVLNDFRIKKALPTVKFLQDAGAKTIILAHIGREKDDTLKPVFENLEKHIQSIKFNGDVLGAKTLEQVESMQEGEVLVMENLRQHSEEKANEENFARRIATLGDIYVNDAFANSHREHASMVGVPKFLPSYAGLLLEEEVEHISKSFDLPENSLFIIGGNKLPTKLPLVKKALEMESTVFVGGALANNFFKEFGWEVGESFIAEGEFNLKELTKNEKLILPKDVVVRCDGDNTTTTKKPNEVVGCEKILDAGNKTVLEIKNIIKETDFILFNGPLGDYKNGFGEPTEEVIKSIADSKAISIVGGGDTTALINNLGIEDKFTFVSTGGGAMLQFLINETLPGIEALK